MLLALKDAPMARLPVLTLSILAAAAAAALEESGVCKVGLWDGKPLVGKGIVDAMG